MGFQPILELIYVTNVSSLPKLIFLFSYKLGAHLLNLSFQPYKYKYKSVTSSAPLTPKSDQWPV